MRFLMPITRFFPFTAKQSLALQSPKSNRSTIKRELKIDTENLGCAGGRISKFRRRKRLSIEREKISTMEVQLKEMLDDLVALKRSLPDLSHQASIDKVFLIHM